MLSYQHIYHAGCFADVIKHTFLSRIMDYMTQKDKPMVYLETHAGRGLYDLESRISKKTGEAQEGIFKLWPHRDRLIPEFSPFIQTILQVNNEKKLRYYPGSAQMAILNLRPQDRLMLCELHPQELRALESLPTLGKKISIEQTDGIEKIKAVVPPHEKRGLIFIDPSYELKTEYQTIPKAIALNYKKFPQGVYVLWYPMLHSLAHQILIKHLKRIPSEKTLHLQFWMENSKDNGMYGTGLFVINSPFVLAEEAKNIFKNLQAIFHDQKSGYLIE
ncbi:MAG: Ribosomal large subunit methyltransferase [Pseudomonadota bacterium]|nr:Ribosomal large subunit methyltransferase [Pseudomonadota bacterium]